nr:methyl-accepting chemotaxis protein [uncultured Lachnoclostridium sp.]
MKNNIRDLNEQVANLYVAKVMEITAAFAIVVIILNTIGIFVVDPAIMTITGSTSLIALLIPAFILKVLKKNEVWLKYVAIFSASVVVLTITVTLNYLVFIMFIFPMALASIYFNPKLNRIALILSIIMSTVGRVLAFNLAPEPDLNFQTWYRLILFSITPNVLMLLAIGAIFSALANNTNKMMSSLVDKEEQEKIFNHMKNLSEKSSEVSKGLLEGMETLGEVTNNFLKANEEISDNTVTVVDGIQSSMKLLNIAKPNSSQIYENVQELAEESAEIAQLFVNVETLSNENKVHMQSVTLGMSKMKESADICQTAMEQLEEKTKKIDGIVSVIADISEQTDLLSLNAAIESARAGEQGKGFAVVAEEIRKLSQQTQKTLSDVKEIIGEVLEQNAIAVNAMNQTSSVHEEQKEVILKAEKSAQGVMLATKEMTEKMQLITNNTKHIEQSTGEIVDIVNGITKISKKNQEALDVVAASVETGSTSIRQLEEVVDSIREMSDELAIVVQS